MTSDSAKLDKIAYKEHHSVQVTWTRTSPMTKEEKLLRCIFKYIGIDPSKAESAALQTIVERFNQQFDKE